MTIAPIATSGPTITVSTTQDLEEAYKLLSQQSGGGTILLESGSYDTFKLYTYGGTDGDQPVVIKSADPDDPAHFPSIYLREVSNIRFENIHVESEPDDGITDNLVIRGATDIQFVDSTFQFDPDNSFKDTGQLGDVMSLIGDSSGLLFENNLITGYRHGLQAMDVTDSDFINNEFVNIQGDGFRGGGLQNVNISGNYMHDFYGVDQNLTHSDMIQIWGASVDLLTKNLTISDNILLAHENGAGQSIFIRNEEFGKVGDPTSGYYENITVSNNLIYNSVLNGIFMENVDGAVVDNNTVLWNPNSQILWGSSEISSTPLIIVRKSFDVAVTDNIHSGLNLSGDVTETNNHRVTYGDTDADDYVGRHFVNVMNGEGLGDIYMLLDSPFYGAFGSDLGYLPAASDEGVMPLVSIQVSPDDRYDTLFSAKMSLDESGFTAGNGGYTYHWTFSDGTTAEGIEVHKYFDGSAEEDVTLEIRLNGSAVADITRSYEIFTKEVFAFDFEGGPVDLSDGTPEVKPSGSVVNSDDGKGYLIGDGGKLEIGKNTDDIFEMEAFGLAFDMKPTGDEQSGTFLSFINTMEGEITSDGRFEFTLSTSEGSHTLISREPIFDDGDTHRLGIAYDGHTGQLEMFADGESVASAEAWGTTAPPKYYPMIFGNTWGDSMDAIIDNVEMSLDPAVAGSLPDITPPAPEPTETEDPTETETPENMPDEETTSEPPQTETSPPDAPEEPSEPEASDPEVDGDERGTPPEKVAASKGGNFIEDLLDKILSLFGMGKGSDNAPSPPASVAAVESAAPALLSDLVPVVEADGAAQECECDEDDIIDIAA